MDPIQERKILLTRRHFFSRSATGAGIAALASLLAENAQASTGIAGFPNFPPKAKRVIYLFQHGAPSQLDLLDYKPALQKSRGAELLTAPEACKRTALVRNRLSLHDVCSR